ncbi:tRNA lysidine(34) synthetase TilS [Chloroflexota bacterium]
MSFLPPATYNKYVVKTEKQRLALEQRVLHFIREHRLVSSRQKLVVAVSGGPDSVCLLHILIRLKKELGIKLHVAHLNHQLRGADSEADAHYVSSLARQLGIPASIEQRDVKSYQAQHRISLEEAAREVRYAFLSQIAKSVGASRVAIGHTTDDHIETILMHLVRGTGTRGLRGLQPYSLWQSSEGRPAVVRPLLEVSREETTSYCHYHQLMPRIDASNLSLPPLRNRIRHQLMPLLESYNPKVSEALLRTARLAGDDLTFLDGEIRRLWGKTARKQENTVILDKGRLLKLPTALKRYLLRASIEQLLGNLTDIEARHIEEIMNVLNKPAGKRLSLPAGLTFSIEYDKYLIGRDPAALSPLPLLEDSFQLKVPGTTLLPGWCIEATTVKREQVTEMDEEFTAYFDLDKAGDKLLVRPRQPGDRFQPLGMNQSKKLGEFMIDAKIPHAWRQRIPIVCSPKHILWVAGWRIDERVRVTANTSQVLCLEFKQR